MMLPAGCARLATKPAPTGSPVNMTIGTVEVARRAKGDWRARSRQNIDLELQKLSNQRRYSFGISLSVSFFHGQTEANYAVTGVGTCCWTATMRRPFTSSPRCFLLLDSRQALSFQSRTPSE